MRMSKEFFVESQVSSKQLNHQSVSLVIPRLTRDKIHSALYYKVNLQDPSMRGNTLLGLNNVIIRDLGTLNNESINKKNVLGGVEFKCILMKLVELRPTIEQLDIILEISDATGEFNNKYIIALILVYLRIQYYYANETSDEAKRFKALFQQYINDYRKMKAISLNIDCWSQSQIITVELIHMDELVHWLSAKDNIWGIPLGKCSWCNILEDFSSDTSSDYDSDSD
ncbi:hypothetical protein TBLA_0F01010 [Henningerozyma blattae CBS 6284]|uniref:Pre-mRNA-splicing factor 38 n=1 Tax=Henningerozyma blattae (strain ATCC 34711 / CBS 6284 / DSM 70876 / NBRC 10599 / NRRL Y-10934 / UCD 77-7) TaxID=1071380 RepID=I2H5J2_HENB6|nr:hypothetical protein TBLA_0F01010 [Tetrapisispora blattae CBS 6284]CCH61644.1 hypothetical protein TBLA_0F01010 [Tetrapisispora blattae CBS 6284]